MENIRSMPGLESGVAVRLGVAEYAWGELKAIARAVAAADGDGDGLRIARDYNLVGKDGKLPGDVKPLTLTDGTRTGVRIIGLRHDVLEGGDKAGISFEFVDVPLRHGMNRVTTNGGGWEASDMRSWLNSDFLALMPSDVRRLVEPVKKPTNNWGRLTQENDTSVVSETVDRIWLLSMAEIYGRLSAQMDAPWSAATYDGEGTQYRLYAERGVTTASCGFCKKTGARSWWWTRSSFAPYSVSFCDVLEGGGWHAAFAYVDGGVSPAFCL